MSRVPRLGGVLLLMLLSGCSGQSSGNSSSTSLLTELSPEQEAAATQHAAEVMCVENGKAAVYDFHLVAVPANRTTLYEITVRDYGPRSKFSTSVSAAINDPAVRQVWRDTHDPLKVSEKAVPVLRKECVGATFERVTDAAEQSTSTASSMGTPPGVAPSATAVPTRGDSPPEFVGYECKDLLAYWGPLIAQPPERSSQTANEIIVALYGGSGMARVVRILETFATNPDRSTNLQSAITQTCASVDS